MFAAALAQVQTVANSGGLNLQFDHSDIAYSSKQCDDQAKPGPCSAFMSLRLSDGDLVVGIHRASNGSITAPILLNSTVREEKDRNDKTIRWSEYSVENETPYVHYQAMRRPSFRIISRISRFSIAPKYSLISSPFSATVSSSNWASSSCFMASMAG